MVNPAEAETVRKLFQLYLQIGSVRRLKEEIDRLGIVAKVRGQADGRLAGGKSFSRGHLYALLSNPLYIGKIRHRQALHEGRHEAILDAETFEAAQERLAVQAPRRRSPKNEGDSHLLKDLLFDETGDEHKTATKGLLRALIHARVPTAVPGDTAAPLPLRIHYFFHNAGRLW